MSQGDCRVGASRLATIAQSRERRRRGGGMEGPAVAEFRAGLAAWLDTHAGELSPRHAGVGTLNEQVTQMQRVKRLLFDADWMRFGWPESVGGLGGSPMLRTELGA